MNTGKKTLLMFVGTGFQQAITFILIIVLSRLLTKDEYATYSQGNLIYKMLLPILQMGIPLTISCFLPKAINLSTEKNVIKNAFKILVAGAIISFGVVFCFKDILSKIYNNDGIATISLYLSLYIMIEIINSVIPNYYIALNLNKRFAIITIVASSLRAILVGVVLLTRGDVVNIFFVMFLVSLFKMLIFMYDLYARYNKVKEIRIENNSIKTLFAFGLIISISHVFGQINALLDQNIVAAMFTKDEYAIFVNGAIEVPFIALIGTSISSVLLPEFTGNNIDNQQILKKWKNGIVYSASVLLPIMIILLFVAPTYVRLIYSEKYLQSISVFRVYLFKIPTMLATFSTLLLAKKANVKILINTIISLVSSIVLNIAFISIIGIEGAALGTIVSLYILMLLQIYQVSKLMNVRMTSVMPIKNLFYIIIISVIVCIVLYMPREFITINRVVYDLVFSVLAIITMFVIFIKVKIINIKYLINIVRRKN